MKNFMMPFNNSLIEKKIYDEIIECNEKTNEYGLKLYDNDVKELINTRKYALERSGRLEFNGEIIDKIIMKFCDSPYIYHNIIMEVQ